MNKLDDLTKSHILLTYVKQAALPLKHKFSIVDPNSVATECPFCGTKQLKGKIYLGNSHRLLYICWKANCTASRAVLASKWLQQVDPQLYQVYLADVNEKENNKSFDVNKLKKKIDDQQKKIVEKQKIEMAKRKWLDDEATKQFVSINDGTELSKIAINYCKSRQIPESIYSKFYIAHDGKYHDRIIIPFYSKDNKIVYFQGRSLVKELEPKYMNRVSEETHLYNVDFVDEDKPIIVLEGPIDSMFVENAVATCGAGSSVKLDHQLAKFPLVYYILDNDDAGNKKAGQLVRKHKNVFLWTKFLNDLHINPNEVKDINDVMLKLKREKPFTFDELQDYFTDLTDEFLCYL